MWRMSQNWKSDGLVPPVRRQLQQLPCHARPARSTRTPQSLRPLSSVRIQSMQRVLRVAPRRLGQAQARRHPPVCQHGVCTASGCVPTRLHAPPFITRLRSPPPVGTSARKRAPRPNEQQTSGRINSHRSKDFPLLWTLHTLDNHINCNVNLFN